MKAPAKAAPLLVLDFDGVICDSASEGFLTSWNAYHVLYRGEAPKDPPPGARARFDRLRPFVRSGQDFVFIQEIMARDGSVTSQADFDEIARQAGPATKQRFDELFYQARAALQGRDRTAWLAMNPIYAHVKEAFSLFPPQAPVYVLSTKRPQFVAEILAAHDIGMAPERILFGQHEPKLRTVEKLVGERGSGGAIFIEDQIDAIRSNVDPRIRVYLASWGYVQPEWLREPTAVPLLTPEAFLRIVREEICGA